jgi:hypothetical protein
MTAPYNTDRLADALAAQHSDLLRAAWRLEQAARLVPAVDETAWRRGNWPSPGTKRSPPCAR